MTEKDLATELLAFVGSIKSEKELQDIAYRSLRTRVNNFLSTGSWPTGTHPYAFGKACYAPDGQTLKWVWQRLRKLASEVYCGGEINGGAFKGLRLVLREFKKGLREAEQKAVKQAERKVTELRQEHRALTLNWAKATDAMQVVLKREIKDVEAHIRDWEPRTVRITERLGKLYEAERERLVAEWPKLESRERGEALRRMFRTVTLYWDRAFHPAETKPSRRRKTDRPGRYRYTLRPDRIEWHLGATDSVISR